MNFMGALLENNLFVISLAVLVGILFGRLEIKGFRFGISGALFAGLLLGHFGVKVPGSYFVISLALFVASVGLMAAKDIGGVVKAHGFKFVVVGFLMATVAAILTYIGARGLGGIGVVDPRYIEGVFTGALTSSPGLGAQLEGVTEDVGIRVTIGHSVAYPFGVVMVIVFQELWPRIRNIDLEEEKRKFKKSIDGVASGESKKVTKEAVTFSVGGFVLALVLGGILGEIPIPLGPLGTTKLGITGGILPAALAVGYIGKIGPINTRMSHEVLSGIRSLTLALFLAVVGIDGGAGFLEAVIESGAVLVLITLFVGMGTIAVGMLLLRGLWDLDWIVTAGAITGGMTSTPGLGAAIKVTETEDVGAGYGSTYPFALLGMVIFAKILSILI
ncbi:MAG: hypothetical protein KGY66_01095 [Candidatus Thermoplasmatota archaeon]|nr:hypothetical protein [Candidatus Thermoplasmatota archaeon]MBS3789496.1 hypothetical protein [Candidatus Thermoplasmatota archaeon]